MKDARDLMKSKDPHVVFQLLGKPIEDMIQRRFDAGQRGALRFKKTSGDYWIHDGFGPSHDQS